MVIMPPSEIDTRRERGLGTFSSRRCASSDSFCTVGAHNCAEHFWHDDLLGRLLFMAELISFACYSDPGFVCTIRVQLLTLSFFETQ
jgi:hypothetical protein